jgi:hypothetical protein
MNGTSDTNITRRIGDHGQNDETVGPEGDRVGDGNGSGCLNAEEIPTVRSAVDFERSCVVRVSLKSAWLKCDERRGDRTTITKP